MLDYLLIIILVARFLSEGSAAVAANVSVLRFQSNCRHGYLYGVLAELVVSTTYGTHVVYTIYTYAQIGEAASNPPPSK